MTVDMIIQVLDPATRVTIDFINHGKHSVRTNKVASWCICEYLEDYSVKEMLIGTSTVKVVAVKEEIK